MGRVWQVSLPPEGGMNWIQRRCTLGGLLALICWKITRLNELESLGESDVSSKSHIFNMSYGVDVSYVVPLDPIMELQFTIGVRRVEMVKGISM